MVEETVSINGIPMRVHSLNTLIVGSGAAAFRAAEALHDLGQQDIAILTEGVRMGTSRNTGSDKQTYYKLTMSGNAPDSVQEMAETLFEGGAVHGDLALVQAALSARSFLHLVEIGVPFPQNRFGEYAGYRTDHDARLRATSAGPLTSRFMTERLEEQVRLRDIRIFDRFLAIGILTGPSDPNRGDRIIGLAALDMEHPDSPSRGMTLFNCTNLIYATGGPAGIYRNSVYPESQTGAMGIALEAGAGAVNLTESQYGIASVKFRWNLSGTYQQVLPRYVSTDADGGDVREFLPDWFEKPGSMLDSMFLKGYQWPFDPAKTAPGGSSVIDLLVGMEIEKGRRVFLDFMRNPDTGGSGGEPDANVNTYEEADSAGLGCGGKMSGIDPDIPKLDFSLLGPEAYDYLARSGALFGRPIDRLRHMNAPAVELYRSHGIDLETEWLEIAVCAQHCNGGLSGNLWWESNLAHFFPIGEVNGSFGIHRPGGSALNATQVGALRASEYIAARCKEGPLPLETFLRLAEQKVSWLRDLAETLARTLDCEGEGKAGQTEEVVPNFAGRMTVQEFRRKAGNRMSAIGAHLRPVSEMEQALSEAEGWLLEYPGNVRLDSLYELSEAFRLRDILLTRYAFLSAIHAYVVAGGGSRGSSLVVEETNGSGRNDSRRPIQEGSETGSQLPGGLDIRLENPSMRALSGDLSLHVGTGEGGRLTGIACQCGWIPVRPIPVRQAWFEDIWRDEREGKRFGTD